MKYLIIFNGSENWLFNQPIPPIIVLIEQHCRQRFQLGLEISRVAQTEFNGQAILKTGAGAFSFQVGPDTVAGANNIAITTTSVGGYASFDTVVGTNAAGVSTAAHALSTIGAVDKMLQSLNTARAQLGAVQNYFDSVIRNGQNAAENLSASRSRIEDADFAQETARLTKFQILQQAGISVLSQANTLPQSVIGLLG